MKKILIVILFVTLSSISESKTIWRNKNLYSSSGNLKIGDILSVRINDISNMKFDLKLKNSTTNDVSSNPDVTITGFLPKIKSDKNIKNSGNTNFEEKGKINFIIAATIERQVAGGKYFLSAVKTYIFNGVFSSFKVTGIVDPILLKGRVVDSNNIANFQINISTSKSVVKLNRKPLKEGETAGVNITEEEKQKFIVEYIEKMLSEMGN